MKKTDTDTLREIVVRDAVVLPALSTDQPARPYTSETFFAEWVLGAPDLRKDESLPHLFEWEEVIEAFNAEATAGLAVEEPPAPEPPKFSMAEADKATNLRLAEAYMAAVEAHREERKPYEEARNQARVGKAFYVSEAAFQAAKAAAKAFLDEKLTAAGTAAAPVNPAWGRKILRHYHAFAQSRAVKPTDIPVETPALLAPPPNGAAAQS
jgi:hypothetical protein